MKNSAIIHIVVMVVAIVIGGYLASYLNEEKLKIEPALSKISKSPFGGFHKFASDVEWMRFINYAGSQKSVNKDNVDEHIRRVEQIVNLDPNFEKAYSVGVSLLAIESPDKAVELLKNACTNDYLKKNWKIPFYAGFILDHHYKDDSRVGEVVEFYQQAVQRAGQPERYLVNALIRAKAKAALKNNPGKYINRDHAILDILYKEWKKGSTANMDGAPPAADGTPAAVASETMVYDGTSSIIPDLSERLLHAAQKAKTTAGNDEKVLNIIAKVRKDILANNHLCDKCLSSYGAGDKFCSVCGNKVVIYGICPKCEAVVHGKFCNSCGHKCSK